MRQFLLSKPTYKKLFLATHKFSGMKSFARLEFEICCIELACFEKFVKDSNGVVYLRVHQDLSDKIVDADRMETKDSKETVLLL